MVTRLSIVTALLMSPGLAAGSTFVVNSTLDAVDVVPGNGVCATREGVCTLRAAIQESNSLSPGGHVITLPAGTYTLTLAGQGETAAATGDLNITSGLKISGDGAATTIIDANGLDRVFHAIAGGLTLNGVTVQNGNPGGTNAGGGIYISGVNMSLSDVVIKSCFATGRGGGISVTGPSTVTLSDTAIRQNVSSADGGGISLLPGTAATMTRTTISGNSSGLGNGNGGGIFVFGSAASPTTLTLTDTTIAQNRASSFGGGVYFVSATGTMIRTTIIGNTSTTGGGIHAVQNGIAGSPGSTLTLTDTSVTQNATVYDKNASGRGGGVSLSSGTTAAMTRTTISGNSSSDGGGIVVSGVAGTPSSLTLTDTTIAQNAAAASYGGGLLIGGGSNATVTISGTTISSNSAYQGGGIYSSGTVTLANTTISGNRTTSFGSGILTGGSAGSAMTLVNVTIASNPSSFGALRVESPGELQVRNTIIANHSNCSLVGSLDDLGNNLEFPGTGCGFALASDRRADPRLAALADNGGPTETHALGTGSPAIDAGDDASCAAAPVSGVDQRGGSRPTGANCDIGAYESASIPFTDSSLVVASTVIRSVHVTELRARINALRAIFRLSPVTWTESNISGLQVKVAHIQEMRSALQAVYSASGRTPPSFPPTLTAGVTVITASHIAELRAAVVALE